MVGWEQAAREQGALRRARGISDAATLLRVLLVHLADGCSLRETAVRAQEAGWCAVSSVSLFKRLQAAEQWLRWMAERLWRQRCDPVLSRDYRVRAVDATTVQEPGSRGTIERAYAKRVVAQRYPAELLAGQKIEKARSLNARPTEGVAGAFVRFMDTQGGASILGEQGFGACLSEYLRRGGAISQRHASNIVTQFYRNRRPAGEDASEATDAGPRA